MCAPQVSHAAPCPLRPSLSSPPAVAIGLDDENFPSGPQYPPTVLVHFRKDGSLTEKVQYMLGEMRRLGRAGVEVAVGETAVTPHFFSSRATMIR